MNKYLLMVSVAVLGVLGFAGGSAAAAPRTIPADPTGGALEDVQDSVVSFVVTYGAPILFGLLGMGIVIRLATRWARRAAAKV